MLAEVQVAFGNEAEAIKLLEDALRRLDVEDDSGRKRDRVQMSVSCRAGATAAAPT
jgi:hypothetical protein